MIGFIWIILAFISLDPLARPQSVLRVTQQDAVSAVEKRSSPRDSHPAVREASVQTLDTKGFVVTITDDRPEGYVAWDDVKYYAVSKKSGKSLRLTGSDWHTKAKEGSPGRFLGYRFKNGNVTYLVFEEGRLTVVRNDSEVLVDEVGAWRK